MDLMRYIAESEESISEFCKRAKINRGTFYRIIKGCEVDWKTINKISKATDKKVDLTQKKCKRTANNSNK